MTTGFPIQEQQPSRQSRRKLARIPSIFVAVTGLAILAVLLENFLVPGETGLGREKGWSAYYYSHELQQAAQVHQKFCESFVTLHLEETYSYYDANHQWRFAESMLGLACIVNSHLRSREADSGLDELLVSYQLDPEIFVTGGGDSDFEIRQEERTQYREALIAQAEGIFADPERRKEFVGQLAEWLRTHGSRHIFTDSSFFIACKGPFLGYMHESGEQAAFQKRIYRKFGRRSGWYDATQYLVKEGGEWKMTGFEFLPAEADE